MDLLGGLGAVEPGGPLTDVGRRMLDLPLHPRLGRMVVDADPADRWVACVLAAVVDERDPFRSRAGETPPADLALRVDAVLGASTSNGPTGGPSSGCGSGPPTWPAESGPMTTAQSADVARFGAVRGDARPRLSRSAGHSPGEPGPLSTPHRHHRLPRSDRFPRHAKGS